jgi:hypothetical protein
MNRRTYGTLLLKCIGFQHCNELYVGPILDCLLQFAPIDK